MDGSLVQIFGQCFLAVVGLAMLVYVLFWICALSQNREKRRRCGRPLVYVCGPINGRVGVVTERDYWRAHRDYWKRVRSGKEQYDLGNWQAHFGLILDVENVFVFRGWSENYGKLVARAYVQKAVFNVPHENELEPLEAAWQYIYGKQWVE